MALADIFRFLRTTNPNRTSRRRQLPERTNSWRSIRLSGMEQLEDRRLMAVGVSIESVTGIGNVLKVRGSDASDTAYVTVDQGGASVRDATTGITTNKPHSQFKEIHVAGNGGNDFVRVKVEPNVSQAIAAKPIKVWGGVGNDSIVVDVATNLTAPKTAAWKSAPETAIEVSGDSGTDTVRVEKWMPRTMSGIERVDLSDETLRLAQQELRGYSDASSGWYQLNAGLFKRIPITSETYNRSSDLYRRVIDQFDVQSSHVKRYRPDAATTLDTRCNSVAGDVMRAMGVPLPTKSGGINDLTKNAADLNQWLSGSGGRAAGWREIVVDSDAKMGELLAHVSAGKPAVASHGGKVYSKEKLSAEQTRHIAVLRPDQDVSARVADKGKLVIAQAGGTNFNRGRLEDVPAWNKIKYDGVRFFVHD